jgi:hypothetical protein
VDDRAGGEETGEPSGDGAVPQETGTAPRRRRRALVPVALVVAIVVGFGTLLAIRSQPEQAVRRLIDREIKLERAVAATSGDVQKKRLDELYATLSEQAKAACDQLAFYGQMTSLRPDFWRLIEYGDIHVRVEGNRATVTYVIRYNGRIVERATSANPDLYVRADATVYGSPVSVKDQLAALERQQQPGGLANPLPPEEYRKARERIIAQGSVRPVLYQKGEWYDDLDRHVRCPEASEVAPPGGPEPTGGPPQQGGQG